jgi:hypothetical protein
MTLIEPLRRHECPFPKDSGTRLVKAPRWFPDGSQPEHIRIPKLIEVGTLWQCPSCFKWWTACEKHYPHGIYPGGGGVDWRRVRWFNFILRHRIRRWWEQKVNFAGGDGVSLGKRRSGALP